MVTVSMIIMLTLYQRGADFGVFLQPQHQVKLRGGSGAQIATANWVTGSLVCFNFMLDFRLRVCGSLVPAVVE